MTDKKTKEIIEANIDLHSRVAGTYGLHEPHFRPENVEKVEARLKQIVESVQGSKLLDLGCGTGFMIQIAKKYVKVIHGIDVTQAMLDKVDMSGNATIKVFNHDSGTFPVQEEYYDVVTAYSFLHHLYDIEPTLETAYKALKPGGQFYVDLEPNYYFWENIRGLAPDGRFDPIVKREIEALIGEYADFEAKHGLSRQMLDRAEYGKNIKGGFQPEEMSRQLKEAGFRKIDCFYHWFIGEGYLINSGEYDKKQRFEYAAVVHKMLEKILPLSKGLFKYFGCIATK